MIIRLFENFDERLYTEISEDDWNDMDIDKKAVDISIPIANKILRILDKQEFELRRAPLSRIDYSSAMVPIIVFFSYLTIKPNGNKLPWDEGYFHMEIWKDYDDYYWIEMVTFGCNLYFKCDQVEGLIELLKFYDIVK